MNYVHVTPEVAVEDLVLAQATSSVANTTLHTVGRHTGGVVLTDTPGMRKAQDLRLTGFEHPLVLDLIRVDWRDTASAVDARARAWTRATCAGAADLVLTPSRRLAAGDRSALTSQLREAQELLAYHGSEGSGSAWIGLALDGAWLSETDHLPVLERHLSAIDSPVALAFADPYDPIGTKDRVRALRRLVKNVDMALVRSDLAGVGAWAYGARFASVGLSSTVRHLPVPMRLSTSTRDRTPHVLIPALLAWVKASALWFAGDHPALRCRCPICKGQWLGRLGDESPGRPEAALLHSFFTWYRITQQLQGAPRRERKLAWHRICKKALEAEESLADDLGVSLKIKWRPLRTWSWL